MFTDDGELDPMFLLEIEPGVREAVEAILKHGGRCFVGVIRQEDSVFISALPIEEMRSDKESFEAMQKVGEDHVPLLFVGEGRVLVGERPILSFLPEAKGTS